MESRIFWNARNIACGREGVHVIPALWKRDACRVFVKRISIIVLSMHFFLFLPLAEGHFCPVAAFSW